MQEIPLIFISNLLITSSLLVLIWIIQILHYQSFHFIGDEFFSETMKFHQRRITYIVLPLMIAEAIVVILDLFLSFNFWTITSALMVLLVWMSTFFIQVPIHQKLLSQKDTKLINQLINTNWIRTVLWTLKFFLLIFKAFSLNGF